MADTANASQTDWTPAAAPSLWTEICETHAGTLDDPIPYSGNMALEFEVIYCPAIRAIIRQSEPAKKIIVKVSVIV